MAVARPGQVPQPPLPVGPYLSYAVCARAGDPDSFTSPSTCTLQRRLFFFRRPFLPCSCATHLRGCCETRLLPFPPSQRQLLPTCSGWTPLHRHYRFRPSDTCSLLPSLTCLRQQILASHFCACLVRDRRPDCEARSLCIYSCTLLPFPDCALQFPLSLRRLQFVAA